MSAQSVADFFGKLLGGGQEPGVELRPLHKDGPVGRLGRDHRRKGHTPAPGLPVGGFLEPGQELPESRGRLSPT